MGTQSPGPCAGPERSQETQPPGQSPVSILSIQWKATEQHHTFHSDCLEILTISALSGHFLSPV